MSDRYAEPGQPGTQDRANRFNDLLVGDKAYSAGMRDGFEFCLTLLEETDPQGPATIEAFIDAQRQVLAVKRLLDEAEEAGDD